ncbi:Exostosin-like [Trema orientale]|uniref:Exostosin-like n=1 Tax=Trema orientale TaxID=63057 RepID=A0A2P5FCR6_TREOI|nr:Exostosin-like [Trema orientale]
MKHYKCLTDNSSSATAIFVPFYAGLDLGRYLWGFNTSTRDNLSISLVSWLRQRPEWGKMWGRDHFLVGGRVSWDFRRPTEEQSEWGSKLMSLPESKNMTLLTIEASSYDNDFAIPYPTYFHPSKDSQVFDWQRRMRASKRPYLFSFAGAPRPHLDDSIRGEIIAQCRSSGKLCKLLSCYAGLSSINFCEEPLNVMKVFERSVFCLQPTGDSYTRRSTFDSILAGCIPVFFHPRSAYKQYLWHFPGNQTRYSVFIPESDVKQRRTSISETLQRVPKSEVLAMREEVIKLIPRIIYANPMSSLERFEDAFDIAVKGVLERVEKVRRKVKEGKDLMD